MSVKTIVSLPKSIFALAKRFFCYLQKLTRFVSRWSRHLYMRLLSISNDNFVENHFRIWSTPGHPNQHLFSLVLENLRGRGAIIVETGTSAWGTDSTRLWDLYVRQYGGSLTSVDICSAPSRRLRGQMSKQTTLVISDSRKFLEMYSGPSPDFVYLDSFDADPRDPFPSALHGLAEFRAIYPKLKVGSMCLIDDTPRVIPDAELNRYPAQLDFRKLTGQNPGKGALVLRDLHQFPAVKVLAHDYALLLQVIKVS